MLAIPPLGRAGEAHESAPSGGLRQAHQSAPRRGFGELVYSNYGDRDG